MESHMFGKKPRTLFTPRSQAPRLIRTPTLTAAMGAAIREPDKAAAYGEAFGSGKGAVVVTVPRINLRKAGVFLGYVAGWSFVVLALMAIIGSQLPDSDVVTEYKACLAHAASSPEARPVAAGCRNVYEAGGLVAYRKAIDGIGKGPSARDQAHGERIGACLRRANNMREMDSCMLTH